MSDDSELPGGWAWSTADDLRDPARVICYGILKAGPHTPGGVPMVRITDFRGGTLDVQSMKLCSPARAAKFPRSVLREGDILVSKDGTIGKVVLVPPELAGGNITQHVLLLPPSEHVDRRFLAQAIRSPRCQAWMKGETKGVALQGVNVGDFRQLPIRVAPLNEQRRIVAKIDALQARSRRAREALDAVPALLDRFRQSVLAAAFRGDLTADWRAKHPDVEPASVLLERIRAERKVRWIEAETEKARARAEARARKKGQAWGPEQDAKAVASARKKAEKKYTAPEPVDAEAEGLPELPEGWCWARLEDLTPADAPIVYGIILPKDHVPDGVPYVRPVDIVAPGVVNPDDLLRTHPDIAAKYERAALQAGDLVYSIVGTIGKWVIIDERLTGANITQSSVRLRPVRGLSAEYLLRALQSPQAGQQTAKLLFGNALQRLNVGHVRELAVPLPPNGEREAMVAAIGHALRVVSRLRGQTASMSKRVDTLDQAVLAKAFRGELVPQDPNDEPASALLDRIKAEREANAPRKKTRRRSRKVT